MEADKGVIGIIKLWTPNERDPKAEDMTEFNDLQAYCIVGIDVRGQVMTKSAGKLGLKAFIMRLAQIEFVDLPISMQIMQAKEAQMAAAQARGLAVVGDLSKQTLDAIAKQARGGGEGIVRG